MQHEFWLTRWREGRIGFHQSQVTPLLERHWERVGLPRGSRVLVPLCGKSLDLFWLLAQGHAVLGVELASLAVEQLVAEHALQPEVTPLPSGERYRMGQLEIVRGDVLELAPSVIAECQGVYDRAALIALPPELRARYVEHVYGGLPPGCRGLLITLEYPQAQLQGPPFSVEREELARRFEPRWAVERLAVEDILAEQPSFRADGVSALSTAAYRLERR